MRSSVETSTNRDYEKIEQSMFGHRDEYAEAPTDEECSIRVRMTPSEPHKKVSYIKVHGNVSYDLEGCKGLQGAAGGAARGARLHPMKWGLWH